MFWHVMMNYLTVVMGAYLASGGIILDIPGH